MPNAFYNSKYTQLKIWLQQRCNKVWFKVNSNLRHTAMFAIHFLQIMSKCKFWTNHSRMNFLFSTSRESIPLRNNSGWLLLDYQNSLLDGIKNQDSHQNNYCPLAFKWNWKVYSETHKLCSISHHKKPIFTILHGGLNWQPGQNKPAAYNLVTFSGILPPNQNIGLVISVLDIIFFGY